MLPLTVAGALVLAACAGDAPVDEEALEADIAVALVPSDPEAVTSVDCVDVADAGPGDEIDCTVTVGDQPLPVVVVFGEDGRVEVTPGLPVLDGVAAAEQLANRFSDELGIATTVECEQAFIVLVPDSAFACVATDDKGVQRTLAVRVDTAGQLEVGLS